MAQYQHLPIYKTTYELLQLVTRATSAFPKAYKYSLGDKLRAEVVEMVVFIFKANSSRADRATHAAALLERLQVVQLLMRLSRDDMVVMGEDGAALAAVALQVDTFLQSRLGLRLHPRKTSINRIERGFDALGFVLRPHARYVRRSTVRNAYHQLDGMCRARAPVADVRNVANSYFGILRQADAWRERSRIGDMLRRHRH